MDLLQIIHGGFFGFLLGDFPNPYGSQGEVFEDGQMWKQIKMLKHHAHFGSDFFNIFEIIGQLNPIDNNLAALMFFQTIDAANQG